MSLGTEPTEPTRVCSPGPAVPRSAVDRRESLPINQNGDALALIPAQTNSVRRVPASVVLDLKLKRQLHQTTIPVNSLDRIQPLLGQVLTRLRELQNPHPLRVKHELLVDGVWSNINSIRNRSTKALRTIELKIFPVGFHRIRDVGIEQLTSARTLPLAAQLGTRLYIPLLCRSLSTSLRCFLHFLSNHRGVFLDHCLSFSRFKG